MATTRIYAQNNDYDHKTVRDLRVQIYYQFENCVDVLVTLTGTVYFIGNNLPPEEVDICYLFHHRSKVTSSDGEVFHILHN